MQTRDRNSATQNRTRGSRIGGSAILRGSITGQPPWCPANSKRVGKFFAIDTAAIRGAVLNQSNVRHRGRLSIKFMPRLKA